MADPELIVKGSDLHDALSSLRKFSRRLKGFDATLPRVSAPTSSRSEDRDGGTIHTSWARRCQNANRKPPSHSDHPDAATHALSAPAISLISVLSSSAARIGTTT